MRWALGALIVSGASAGMIAAILRVRRHAPEGGYFDDGDRAAGVFGVLATGFALLLGFVIFLAFTKYDGSHAGAEAVRARGGAVRDVAVLRRYQHEAQQHEALGGHPRRRLRRLRLGCLVDRHVPYQPVDLNQSSRRAAIAALTVG